jgi:SAM-dependent methyltransferase
MDDFRIDFYANYEAAIGAVGLVDDAHYRSSGKQYRARWEKWLPQDRTARMLDLACGGGEYISFLLEQGYTDVQGVDFSAGQVARAHARGLTNVVRGDVVHYLGEEQCNTFDVISAFNFFEHLTKPEVLPLLRRIHRALRPNGRLLLVTPNGLSPFSGANRYADFSHDLGYTPNAWRQLARVIGYREFFFEDNGPIPYSIPGVVRSVLWKGVTLVLDGLSYIEIGAPRDSSHVYTADMKIILTKG